MNIVDVRFHRLEDADTLLAILAPFKSHSKETSESMKRTVRSLKEAIQKTRREDTRRKALWKQMTPRRRNILILMSHRRYNIVALYQPYPGHRKTVPYLYRRYKGAAKSHFANVKLTDADVRYFDRAGLVRSIEHERGRDDECHDPVVSYDVYTTGAEASAVLAAAGIKR